MVVTGLSPMALTGIWQERTGWPSRCTVQAPHRAMPQPNFVPVSPSVSRRTQSSGVSGSTSTSTALPLTLSLVTSDSPWVFGEWGDYMPVALFVGGGQVPEQEAVQAGL